METVVLLVAASLLPTAAGYAYVIGRRVHAARAARRPALPGEPLQAIHADLRRLYDLLEETENAPSDLPAKNHRCQATRAAYVDALTAACHRLEVPLTAGRPLPRAEIYRLEAELRVRGLDVRPAG